MHSRLRLNRHERRCIATWPTEIVALMKKLAQERTGSSKYTPDLHLPDGTEATFRSGVQARVLRTYHCTRLLPHEVESVRRDGLRMLTADLLTQRIDDAARAGALSAPEAAALHASHVFSQRTQQHRENQVCLSLSRNTFRDVAAVDSLLSIWGGEGIYMTSGGRKMEACLRRTGRPAIVVALIPVERSKTFPDLSAVFVGALLKFDDVGADVFHRAPIPAEGIEAIWLPGDPNYDAFAGLPTE
jgi:hypothetical protein